ncbi:hypothetical protein RUND412_010258 [Rhizina undulata]
MPRTAVFRSTQKNKRPRRAVIAGPSNSVNGIPSTGVKKKYSRHAANAGPSKAVNGGSSVGARKNPSRGTAIVGPSKGVSPCYDDDGTDTDSETEIEETLRKDSMLSLYKKLHGVPKVKYTIVFHRSLFLFSTSIPVSNSQESKPINSLILIIFAVANVNPVEMAPITRAQRRKAAVTLAPTVTTPPNNPRPPTVIAISTAPIASLTSPTPLTLEGIAANQEILSQNVAALRDRMERIKNLLHEVDVEEWSPRNYPRQKMKREFVHEDSAKIYETGAESEDRARERRIKRRPAVGDSPKTGMTKVLLKKRKG